MVGTGNQTVTQNIWKAEDGTKAKYTIAVTRKSAEGEIIPNVIPSEML